MFNSSKFLLIIILIIIGPSTHAISKHQSSIESLKTSLSDIVKSSEKFQLILTKLSDEYGEIYLRNGSITKYEDVLFFNFIVYSNPTMEIDSQLGVITAVFQSDVVEKKWILHEVYLQSDPEDPNIIGEMPGSDQ